MTGADRSPAAVAARIREAFRLGRTAADGCGHAKGVRLDGASVRARLRQADELRRLALRLGRGRG